MSATIASPTPLSDEFIYALSRAIPEYSFERNASGGLVVAPNHTEGGRKSGEAYYQLRRWVESTGIGGQVFDATSGFRLPDSSLVAPDAAWLSEERIAALTESERTGFWHVCPDVAIEVASASDRWPEVCAKIDAFVRNGTGYAIAIDPRTGDVYERGTPPGGLGLEAKAIASA